jgi:hypothetical protein
VKICVPYFKQLNDDYFLLNDRATRGANACATRAIPKPVESLLPYNQGILSSSLKTFCCLTCLNKEKHLTGQAAMLCVHFFSLYNVFLREPFLVKSFNKAVWRKTD